MRGFFITLEGPDGAGKTTQALRLDEYLKQKGYSTLLTREPGGTSIGEQIRNVLLNPDNGKMDFKTEILLYAASRAQLLKEVIKPALADGKIVISDRFVDSSIAYQGYGRNINLEMVVEINKLVVEDNLPDLTILLDLPAEVGFLRNRTNNKTIDRIEKEKIDFHQRVLNGFKELAVNEGRFKIIKADRDEEAIFLDIVQVVEEKLQGGI